MKKTDFRFAPLSQLTRFPRRIAGAITTLLTNTLGLIVTKLRSHPVSEKVAGSLRNRFPGLWRAAMRIVKPLYLTYQWRMNSKIIQELSKSAYAFNSEEWKKRQMARSHNYASHPTCSGIENIQPCVDPQDLLDRINKNLAAYTR